MRLARHAWIVVILVAGLLALADAHAQNGGHGAEAGGVQPGHRGA